MMIINLLKIAFVIEWPDPKNYYEYTDVYEFETEGDEIIHEEFMEIIATEISDIKDILKIIREDKNKNKERDITIEKIKDIITKNAKFISIKENITQLIQKYDNHNISIIPGLLDKWKNREGKLLNNIIEKFKKKYSSFSDIKDKDVKIKGDPIIQIGTVFYDYGLSEDNGKKAWHRNILVIGPNDNMKDEEICSKMNNLNIDVVPCKDEKDLLIKWSELIKEYDPDFITGYNIFGFDFKYIKDTFLPSRPGGEDKYKNRLFNWFVFFWGLYGVCAVMSYTYKNTGYNILDIFSKNFFGLFLAYTVWQKVKEL